MNPIWHARTSGDQEQYSGVTMGLCHQVSHLHPYVHSHKPSEGHAHTDTPPKGRCVGPRVELNLCYLSIDHGIWVEAEERQVWAQHKEQSKRLSRHHKRKAEHTPAMHWTGGPECYTTVISRNRTIVLNVECVLMVFSGPSKLSFDNAVVQLPFFSINI